MDFITHLKKYLTDEEINKLIDSLNQTRTNFLFVNTNKISCEELITLYPNIKKTPLIPNCFSYSKDEYDFGKSYLFDNGAIYIMDSASQLVPLFLPLDDNDVVLDICAAPGGKSLCLALKNKTIHLLSNDLSYPRAKVLSSNVEKLALDNVTIISNDFSKNSKDFIEKFDKILLDAPCSGSAMFRKLEDIKADWTYEKVLKQQAIQKELIEHAYIMLKKGGYLMYSTCSFSYEEDEEVILNFLNNHEDMETISLLDDATFYHSKNLKEGIHIFPYLFDGEGQYFILLQKKGVGKPTNFEINKKIKKTKIKELNKYNLDFNYIENINNFVYGYNYDFNLKNISTLRKGILLGEIQKDIFKPSFNFAHYLSSTNSIKLTEEEMKKYLHGDVINKDLNLKNDYYVVSYNNINLGFVKYVKPILKNLYPKGLRH